MSADELRARLAAVVASGFAPLPHHEMAALAHDALEALGSPDPALRDELAYRVLAQWIDERVLPPDDVRDVLRRARSDELLFARIGESGTSSVFRRTFSLLVIAVALTRDRAEPFLGQDEWRTTLDRVVAYCSEERDLRAHVTGSGWAHAVAHAADVVDALVAGRYATAADARRLFAGLRSLVDRADQVFQGEEDERVAIALAAMLAGERVEPAELRAWLQGEAPPGAASAADVRRINWKLVARSLLFRLQREQPAVAKALAGLDRPFSIY
jgi:Protein of unknown function (DUF2785)